MTNHSPSRTRAALALAVLLLLIPSTACNKGVAVAPVHQGAANSFDSTSWDALVSIQTAIEKAKVNPPPEIVPALRKVIDGYNLAEKAWQVYHTAAIAGTATPADQSALAAQITALQQQLSSLGGK